MRCLSGINYVSISELMKNTIETGFHDFDKHVFDLKPGEITVLVGRNGEGKSTVASQILAHHINRGGRGYLFSGELSPTKIQSWFYCQVVGSNDRYYKKVNTKYGELRELKEEVVSALKTWHEARLFIYYNDSADYTAKTGMMFQDMETLSGKAMGVDLFIIDNAMTAIMADASKQNADQSNLIQHCKDFAVRKNKHVVILVHPNKDKGELEENAEKGNIEKTDISGTNDIPNKADNIIAIERVWKTIEDDRADMFFTSLKDRWSGNRKMFKYKFNHNSLRFYNNSTSNNVQYDWVKYLPQQLKTEGESVEWMETSESPF